LLNSVWRYFLAGLITPSSGDLSRAHLFFNLPFLPSRISLRGRTHPFLALVIQDLIQQLPS
jgi:hypothetical protein